MNLNFYLYNKDKTEIIYYILYIIHYSIYLMSLHISKLCFIIRFKFAK